MNEEYFNQGYKHNQRRIIKDFESEIDFDIYRNLINALYFHIQAMQRRYNRLYTAPSGSKERINPLAFFIKYNEIHLNRIVLNFLKLKGLSEFIPEELLDHSNRGFYDFYVYYKQYLPEEFIEGVLNEIAISIREILYHRKAKPVFKDDATMWVHNHLRLNSDIIYDEEYPITLTKKLINEFIRVSSNKAYILKNW